ncbi:MAG: sensor histidine kinase [Ignavibacteriales bacterium]|nr:sensor histidine kinase [Ignavibacteriales bacterium]
MALFPELDPDPIISIDKNGSIISTNKAGKTIIKETNTNNNCKTVEYLFPKINYELNELIEKNESIVFQKHINKTHYNVLLRGISEINVAHAYFHDITTLKDYENELQESKQKLLELSNHIQQLVEQERNLVASELHDNISQKLLLLKINLDKIVQNYSINENSKDIVNTNEILESTISEIKEIIYNLKPKFLEEMGLGTALTSLCSKIESDCGIKGSIDINNFEIRLDKKLELMLYRITQEALNNIVKHSRAKEFNIQLLYNSKKNLKLIISDDGVGFNSALQNTYKGFGLLNIKQRVESENGKFKIDSTIDSGTILFIEIPIK